jgi:hypothetical protein
MAGVKFDQLFADFKSGKSDAFSGLGAIQIAFSVYVLVIAGIAFIAFCCKDKCWSLILVILLFLSFIFTAAVAALSFVTGTGILIHKRISGFIS